MTHSNYIIDDIKRTATLVKPGLFVIDVGFYFPYANQDALHFSVGLSSQTDYDSLLDEPRFEDVVYNHRYPNKGYVTLSKKVGRRVSKIGYFVNDDIDVLNNKKWLLIDFEIGTSESIHVAVPINLQLTEENNASGVEVHMNLTDPNEPSFTVYVYTPHTSDESGVRGWHQTRYCSPTPDVESNDGVLLDIDGDASSEVEHRVVYKTCIEVPACKREDLMV